MQAAPGGGTVQLHGSLCPSIALLGRALAALVLFAFRFAARQRRVARAGDRIADVATRNQRPGVEQRLRRADRIFGAFVALFVVINAVFIAEVAVAKRIAVDEVDLVIDDVGRRRRLLRLDDAGARQRATVDGAVRCERQGVALVGNHRVPNRDTGQRPAFGDDLAVDDQVDRARGCGELPILADEYL